MTTGVYPQQCLNHSQGHDECLDHFDNSDDEDESADSEDEEISPDLTLRAENIEEPLQVSSAMEVSNEVDGETKTTIEQTDDGCKKREDIEVDTNGIEDLSGHASEAFYKSINQGVEAYGNDDIALGSTTQANETEDQHQVSSSVVLFNEEYRKLQPRLKTLKMDAQRKNTRVDNGNLEETSGLVSQPLSTTYESANNVVEGSDTDTVKVEETKILEAVSEPEDPGFEGSHEIQKSSTIEVVETGTTMAKIEDDSTKNVESEVDNIKLEETTVVLSEFPITESEELSKSKCKCRKIRSK